MCISKPFNLKREMDYDIFDYGSVENDAPLINAMELLESKSKYKSKFGSQYNSNR